MVGDARVLRELAEEVERLSKEGSFDVECRIIPALFPEINVTAGVATWMSKWTPGTRVKIPSYTRSIDAAMAMKPKRWRLANLREEPTEIGGWHAAGHRPSPGVAVESGTARTAALAIAALWLRALAADLERTDADPS